MCVDQRFQISVIVNSDVRAYAENVPELLSYYVDKLVDADGLTFRRFDRRPAPASRSAFSTNDLRQVRNIEARA
jgi:hypothetical protein